MNRLNFFLIIIIEVTLQKNLNKPFSLMLEYNEALYWKDYYNNKSMIDLSINYDLIENAFCFAIPETDTLAFNRVLLIGLKNKITDSQLNKIINFYKSIGSKRFMIQVSPFANPRNFEEILLRNGFYLHNYWSKLYMELKSTYEISNKNLMIEQIGEFEINDFNKIILEAFQFENNTHQLFGKSIDNHNWSYYLVKENDIPIAVSSLFINDGTASLAVAATLPNARGKGAQTLMIKRRLNDAFLKGCRYAVVETAKDTADKPSVSYRNVIKNGFKLAYHRPNFVYDF